MSGRPSDPSYAVLTWDVGNYPAGGNDWNGTPKRVAPAGTYLSPNDGAGAQNGNYLWGAGFDADVAAKAAITAVTRLIGQNPALNWGSVVTDSAAKTCNRAAWSTKDQAWWAVGPTVADSAIRSYDYGRSWVDVTLGGALTCLDVAVDASGNVSIITTARTVYYGTRSAYNSVSFASTANALTAAPTGGAMAFDSTTGRFIACYQAGGTVGHVDTSTNGTVWTSQTIPATWSTWSGTASPVIASAAGITIANYFDTVNAKLRVMRSPDGGTTWTEVGILTAAFTPSLVHRAAYDEVNAVWYIAISATTPSRATQIWKSTDGGTTWTSVVSLAANDWFCNGLVCIGALLVMVNDDGRIAWSTDAASWTLVGRNPQSTSGTAALPLGLRAGGGGMILVNATDKSAFMSQRFGDYGQAV